MEFLNKIGVILFADQVFNLAANGRYVEALEKINNSNYSDHDLSQTQRGIDVILLRSFLWRETYTRKLDDVWLKKISRIIDKSNYNLDEKYYLNHYANNLFSLDNIQHAYDHKNTYSVKKVRESIKRNFPLG